MYQIRQSYYHPSLQKTQIFFVRDGKNEYHKKKTNPHPMDKQEYEKIYLYLSKNILSSFPEDEHIYHYRKILHQKTLDHFLDKELTAKHFHKFQKQLFPYIFLPTPNFFYKNFIPAQLPKLSFESKKNELHKLYVLYNTPKQFLQKKSLSESLVEKFHNSGVISIIAPKKAAGKNICKYFCRKHHLGFFDYEKERHENPFECRYQIKLNKQKTFLVSNTLLSALYGKNALYIEKISSLSRDEIALITALKNKKNEDLFTLHDTLLFLNENIFVIHQISAKIKNAKSTFKNDKIEPYIYFTSPL